MKVPEITLNDVSFSFNEDEVISGINMTIKPGIHCILGPNGAGKTVTNKIIALLKKVNHGSVKWDDEIVNPWIDDKHREQKIKSIGYLWQNPYFLDMSVLDNIAYPLKLRGYPKDDRKKKAREWLKTISLEEKENVHPSELSIGQRHKIALGRMLISNPLILILDEPTASLDQTTTKWFEQFIKDLQSREKKLIIWITHDFFQMRRVADFVTLIMQGKVVESCEVGRFLTHKNPIVQKFISGEL
ncbi:MAG: ABC transporter ATP-binding protein [Candidatus Heimdallarchaeota archaeon]|nr:ABC transporter ATP-binding protein [Candidatus Heimdallarchaeota archaeon]